MSYSCESGNEPLLAEDDPVFEDTQLASAAPHASGAVAFRCRIAGRLCRVWQSRVVVGEQDDADQLAVVEGGEHGVVRLKLCSSGSRLIFRSDDDSAGPGSQGERRASA